MGDTGYLDSQGRLWFTGRVAHSFVIGYKEFYPIPVEQYFVNINSVEKAAFVKVSDDKTCIIVQGPSSTLDEVKDVIYRKDLQVDYILFHPSFPVDIRHNIKIDRQQLTSWAKKSLKL
jgi:acyl-coenzyme A synthetase/AMP-(fatty) acid ligase